MIKFDWRCAVVAALGFLCGTVYVGAARAATSTLGPAAADIEVVQLDENCRLVRQVAKARAPHARPAPAAVGKPKAKPRRRLYRTDPPPAEEVICDDGAITPLSVLPAEPTPEFTPVPPESFARLSTFELVPPLVEPPAIEYGDALAASDLFTASPSFPGLGYFGQQLIVIPAVPEPPTWMLMLCAVAVSLLSTTSPHPLLRRSIWHHDPRKDLRDAAPEGRNAVLEESDQGRGPDWNIAGVVGQDSQSAHANGGLHFLKRQVGAFLDERLLKKRLDLFVEVVGQTILAVGKAPGHLTDTAQGVENILCSAPSQKRERVQVYTDDLFLPHSGSRKRPAARFRIRVRFQEFLSTVQIAIARQQSSVALQHFVVIPGLPRRLRLIALLTLHHPNRRQDRGDRTHRLDPCRPGAVRHARMWPGQQAPVATRSDNGDVHGLSV